MNFKTWILNEFDKDLFSDVSYRCLDHEEVANILNKQLERYKSNSDLKPNQRQPFAKGGLFPQISRGNLEKIEDSELKIKVGESFKSVEKFAELITTTPKTIFDEGEKSIHSNELDADSHTVNTGLSALRSVVYSKKDNKFYSINTCPGAGDCIVNCFALKGFYVSVDGKNMKLIQRVNYLMNNPKEYQKKALEELIAIASVVVPQGKTLNIRWNDAGDFFSEVYLNIAINVTNKLKSMHPPDTEMDDDLLSIRDYKSKSSPKTYGDKIQSYAYTKMHKRFMIGQEHGMTMNFSVGSKQSEIDKFGKDIAKTKLSIIVPREAFEGIFERPKKDQPPTFKKNQNLETLKNAIWDWIKKENIDQKYNVSKESLVLTKELLKIKGEPLQYNAIVLQKDSDIAAQRKDVKISFLLEH